jgi:hypothetical protein
MRSKSMKRNAFRHVSILLVCVGALFTVRASSADDASIPETVEPQPPGILELVQVGGAAGDSIVAIEAVVRPVVDGEVELQVLSPAGLRFEGRARAPRYRIQRGGRIHRERLLVEISPLKPTSVRIRANLSNADGEVWLSVDRELHFNKQAPDASRVRIPIVRTAPDGSRTVEYIERREAARRGLRSNGSPKSGAAESHRQNPATLPGGDAPATPVIQE